MSGRNVRFLVGSFLMFALCGAAAAAAAPEGATRAGPFATPPDPAQVRQQLGGIVVPFQGNAGQEDRRVAYTARTLDGTLYVTRDGRIVHSFAGKPKEAKPKAPALGGREVAPRRGPGWTLTETLVDARPRLQDGPASSIGVSRFVGRDPKRWAREVPTFESVSLGEAWPGITVELAARGRNVEKLFTVAPGADARRIGVRMSGAKRLALDLDGALIAHTGNGPIAFTAPVAWQDIDGLRRPVEVRYALAGNRYGFRLGEHDPSHAVVIDPLVQYTYVGGGLDDFLWDVALAPDGDVYAVGYTSSPDFPGTAGGAQPAAGTAAPDAFVARFDSELEMLQATFYGGNGSDFARSMGLNSAGHVVIAGFTSSTNLPGTAGGAQPASAGSFDAFAAKFSPDLKTLLQATYVGTGGVEQFRAMAIDAADSVFLAGTTNGNAFPGVAGGAQPAFGAGGADGVVVKLSADLTTRLQSTYLGGSGIDEVGNLMAIDSAGSVLVTGRTTSANFPTTAGAAQTAYGGGANDVFVVKFANDLKTRIASTLLGGAGSDIGFGVAVDEDDNVYAVGSTDSADFPGVAGGPQPVYAGDTDGFLAVFTPALSAPASATYIGGSGFDDFHAVAIQPGTGTVHIVGNTLSADYPTWPGAASAAASAADASGALRDPAGRKRTFKAGVNTALADARLKVTENPDGTVTIELIYAESRGTLGNILEGWGTRCEHQETTRLGQPLQLNRCVHAISTNNSFANDAGPNAAEAKPGVATAKAHPAPKRQLANAGGFDGVIAEIVAPNYQGLWWRDPAASESGWGINFSHQGSTIFVTWYTYDLEGKPWWLAALAEQIAPGVYKGDLFTVTGPPFNAEPFDPATVVETTIGTLTLTFTDDNHATFDYTVNVNAPAKLAVTQSKPITRLEFGTVPRCIWGAYPNLAQLDNYLDLWWRIPPGSESGWGINFTHQDDTIFATWFTYDLAGKPWWLGFLANKTAEGVYSGEVFTTTGPAFNAEPFNPASVVETTVGTATLTFTDGNNATFAYTVNGVSQTKPITRQVFAGPGTGCR